ncbi:MAG: helix-turn-helix transcriptional regulator [Clostridia bacterium]|nr:helix-turn-helix transcriptional regulator [Clostridia bacterium]
MLNERIKILRMARNLSQVELAKKLNVSKQSVSNWENDNILPSIETLVEIARFFSVSTDYLLGLDDRKFIEVERLSETEIAHIKFIIEDMVKNKGGAG